MCKDGKFCNQIADCEHIMLNNKTAKLFLTRLENAEAVIDAIAELIGMRDKGHYLYGLVNGRSRLADKLDEYLDRSGDKVKLKKRIEELENENAVLQKVLGRH